MSSLRLFYHFLRTRYGLRFAHREALVAWQEQQLRHFFQAVLPRAPRYQGMRITHLSDLPLMDKATMMADFAAHNTRGVTADEAFAVALQAEKTRDFSPKLGDLTVGLSSGTSGNRGLFLVSQQEQDRWAGILLARMLQTRELRQLLQPWRAPLKIAFFLRANSHLYTTLRKRRIDFQFYDLLQGLEAALPRLQRQQPDILVAPPSMLRLLAVAGLEKRLSIRPRRVISVAEVAEAADKQLIQQVFGVSLQQIYQATEGFLAYTCAHGGLHLNETFVHFEPQWLDAEKKRFQPIITDFTRDTQLIVRYQLNDVLRLADEPCSCGGAERTLAAIEGRADEVLWLERVQSGRLEAIFPDHLRRMMALCGACVREFSVVQREDGWQVALASDEPQHAQHLVQQLIADLCEQRGLMAPNICFETWQPPIAGAKRRRVQCLLAKTPLASLG